MSVFIHYPALSRLPLTAQGLLTESPFHSVAFETESLSFVIEYITKRQA